jgi:DNA uptake protein ComE-like DNA-binding protein
MKVVEFFDRVVPVSFPISTCLSLLSAEKKIGEMNFWHYTRKERSGILVLVAVYLLLLVLPDYLQFFFPVPPVPLTEKAWWHDVSKDSSMAGQGKIRAFNGADVETDSATVIQTPIFHKRPFDPNTIGEGEWLSMGLPGKLTRTIMHYRAKGGRFRRAEDIRRIYGMTDDLYRLLVPWVSIVGDAETGEKKMKGFPQSGTEMTPGRYVNTGAASIDVNIADTGDWIALKGVGQVLARRIVRFREKLGGFYAVEQVAETYGLPDSVFEIIRPRLTCAGEELKKIKINTDSLYVLERHPYIGRTIARQLLRYREQNGPFDGPESLLSVESLEKGWLDKIRPYLDFR